jgi:hypothetical protein
MSFQMIRKPTLKSKLLLTNAACVRHFSRMYTPMRLQIVLSPEFLATVFALEVFGLCMNGEMSFQMLFAPEALLTGRTFIVVEIPV